MTMIDPRFLVEQYANSDEEWLFNMPDYRGGSSVELEAFDAKGNIVPSREISADEFVDAVNDACAALGPRLTLYFYDAPLEGAWLARFPKVESLQIASHKFTSPEVVGTLPNLTHLIYDAAFCSDPKRLSILGVDRLKELTMVETPDRKLDLSPLADAQNLRLLRLMGQYRNVEAISALKQLHELVLYPARRLDLSFLEGLSGLQSLKLAIGALESLESLGELPNLRDLSFEWVRFLEELGDLQRFPSLERFRLNDQKRVKRIVTGAKNARLQHITLGGAPMLSEIEGLGALSRLISLSAHSTDLALDQLDIPESLTHLQITPRRMKERAAISDAIKQRGLTADVHPDADFFYK